VALPTGSGSEIITNAKITGLGSSWTSIFTPVALHIYTVVSIIVTNEDATARTFTLAQTDGANTTNIHYFLIDQDVGNKETFVFNDKISWTDARHLRIIGSTSSNLDVYCTYIDQDWT